MELQLDTVMEGDCRELLPQAEGPLVDLIITDPPYLTTNAQWDKEEAFTPELVADLARLLKDTGSLYVWCGIGEKSQSLIRWFPLLAEHFQFKDLITWKKQRGHGGRKGWLYTREEIMWWVKDSKKFVWNREHQYSEERRKRDGGKDEIRPSQNGKKAKSIYKRLTNVWTDISEPTFSLTTRANHETPKPEKAIERIILAHTEKGDVVLDPFLGSGTTAKVAQRLERHWVGIEKDRSVCEQSRSVLEYES